MFSMAKHNEAMGSTKVLGNAVWWTIHQKNISYESMKSHIANVGLDTDNLAAPTPKKAFGRTAKGLSNGVSFFRKITDDMNRVVVGQVAEDVNVAKETVAYEQVSKAVFKKEDDSVTVEGQDSDKFLATYNINLEQVTEADVRGFVLRTVDQLHGVSLRKTGGIYFVPQSNSEKLEALGRLLEQTGLGILYAMRVPDGVSERAITWESFEKEIEEKINVVLDKVNKITKKGGCLPKHAEALEGLQMVLASYTELCNEEAKIQAIKNKIQEAQEKVSAKVSEIELGKA